MSIQWSRPKLDISRAYDEKNSVGVVVSTITGDVNDLDGNNT